jgi:hypothetical protein
MKNNTYNFEATLQQMNDHELIDRFNQEVGNQGWGNARAAFLYALRNELLSRDFDASKIIYEDGMSLKRKICLKGKEIDFVV